MPLLRIAVRNVVRAPGLGAAAVACLALGTAATSAVATLIGALLLAPLPFPHADRLVRVWFSERDGNPRLPLSIPDLADVAELPAFDALLGTARVRVVALLGGGAERLRGEG